MLLQGGVFNNTVKKRLLLYFQISVYNSHCVFIAAQIVSLDLKLTCPSVFVCNEAVTDFFI